ncbi:hypothetical protein MAH1_02340 [Sessilibacter sp. MAH1]
MDRKDLRDLELALGIQTPWFIKAARFNESERCYDIALDTGDKKLLTTFFSSNKKISSEEDLVTGRWRYANVGNCPVYVHANVPKLAAAEGGFITRDVLNRAAFLGDPTRNYSNLVRQQVALALVKGLDTSVISSFLGINESMVQLISEDIKRSTAVNHQLFYVPTEVDRVWENVLKNQLPIRTQLLPLKFLLSRLTLLAAKSNSGSTLLSLAVELRKFFIENHNQLQSEIEQLCGVNSDRLRTQVRQNTSKQRLILPAAKSPVWLELLSGTINLNSGSVPLNLLISRQRSVFVQGKTESEKLQSIDTIREYFRKNYRSLIQELVLLNKWLNTPRSSELSLPEAEHQVWQKILENENFIPSEHMAYRLLLAKLRAQVMTKPDPVIKLQAARRIRDFLGQNQKTMRQEVGVLMKQAAAV